MGEDIGLFEGSFKVTRGLLKEFGPSRIVDTPISEAGFVGIGIGAAMAGLRPVIEIMTVNFSIVAMDQIVNNAAKIRYMFGGQVAVPIVIRMPGGAGTPARRPALPLARSMVHPRARPQGGLSVDAV